VAVIATLPFESRHEFLLVIRLLSPYTGSEYQFGCVIRQCSSLRKACHMAGVQSSHASLQHDLHSSISSLDRFLPLGAQETPSSCV
jgi:hypothetical protein